MNSQESSTSSAAKCPVCDWEIKDDGIKAIINGKELKVCCEACLDAANGATKQPD